MSKIKIVGAGLAGCEAAWQIANAGVKVRLIDMKPKQMTPAHSLPWLAELVCSNSFRAARIENAVGLLKEEMRRLNSLIIMCADQTAIPAGGALAVDREKFAQVVTTKIKEHPLIEFESKRVDAVPLEGIVILATGPLTEGNLFADIERMLGAKTLHFFDAAAPIIDAESIDFEQVFRQSRYGRGSDDYINCPLDKNAYERFCEQLLLAKTAEVHQFENKKMFEGCLPLESLAARGIDTMRFGPLKPVGLLDPRTGKEPYACVQLRQDNKEGTLYNLVGFQTRLTFPEQRRVFRLIPGLEKVEFARYGVMHRNTFLQSPSLLKNDFSVKNKPGLFFAGQITGVEGYVESAASGLIAGMQAALVAKKYSLEDRGSLLPDAHTVLGALALYISSYRGDNFQPMNANFGLLARPQGRFKGKKEKIEAIVAESLMQIDNISQHYFDSIGRV